MTSSKNRRENAWHQRKHTQQPHGKVKSLEELSQEGAGTKSKQEECCEWTSKTSDPAQMPGMEVLFISRSL